MKLNVLQPPKQGDQCKLAELELDKLIEEGCYDSYSRVYSIQGKSWRVVGKVNRADGTTEYTLECEGED